MDYLDTTRKLPVVQRKQKPARTITATIAYHPDLSRVGESASCAELHNHQSFYISRLTPNFFPSENDSVAGKSLADPYLSRSPIKMELREDCLEISPPEKSLVIRVNGQYLTEMTSLSAAELESGATLSIAETVVLVLHWSSTICEGEDVCGLVGYGDAIRKVREKIRAYGASAQNVLIRGETGTGKELVAKALHQFSSRRDAPWLAINMAAISGSLVNSELFGSAKGAFSGATHNKPGLIEQADNGTLFMDEIGEVGTDIQSPLLRVLDIGELQPVGAKPRKVNVRFISATDANLEQRLSDKQFSHALLERLSALVIDLPPLRERREDIGLLVRHFLQMESQKKGKQALEHFGESYPDLSRHLANAVEWACNYSWPGNIRQLRNWVQRLMIENTSKIAWRLPEAENFLPMPIAPRLETADGIKLVRKERRKPDSISSEELKVTLKNCRWQLSTAAETLQISRAALYKLIDATPSIRRARDITEAEISTEWKRCDGDLEKMVDALQVSPSALKRRLYETECSE